MMKFLKNNFIKIWMTWGIMLAPVFIYGIFDIMYNVGVRYIVLGIYGVVLLALSLYGIWVW